MPARQSNFRSVALLNETGDNIVGGIPACLPEAAMLLRLFSS